MSNKKEQELVKKNTLGGPVHIFKSEEEMQAEKAAKLKLKEEANATKKISQ